MGDQIPLQWVYWPDEVLPLDGLGGGVMETEIPCRSSNIRNTEYETRERERERRQMYTSERRYFRSVTNASEWMPRY